MSAPDPTAGERKCDCDLATEGAPSWWVNLPGLHHLEGCPMHPLSPPAAASTGTSEDVEAPNVIQRIVNAWDCCGTCAGGVLARYVADREAAARAEERQRIAQAIEAMPTTVICPDPVDGLDHTYPRFADEALADAARIAREGRP